MSTSQNYTIIITNITTIIITIIIANITNSTTIIITNIITIITIIRLRLSKYWRIFTSPSADNC